MNGAVNPNAPAYPSQGIHNELDRPTSYRHEGIPIRLAIAAQIMAAANHSDAFRDPIAEARRALTWADVLIATHNKAAKP